MANFAIMPFMILLACLYETISPLFLIVPIEHVVTLCINFEPSHYILPMPDDIAVILWAMSLHRMRLMVAIIHRMVVIASLMVHLWAVLGKMVRVVRVAFLAVVGLMSFVAPFDSAMAGLRNLMKESSDLVSHRELWSP